MVGSDLGIDPDIFVAFRGARVLVTGGGGFIARHLGAALVSMRANAVLVGCGPPPAGPVVHQVPVGSESFRRFLKREAPFDFVFHLAGRATATGSVASPAIDFAANLAATVDLLEQLRLRGAPTRLVFASSAAVYGRPNRLPIEEGDSTVPVSPYGLSKLATEQYIGLYARLYNLSAASVRPFSVYGPLQSKQVVFNFLRELRRSSAELSVLGGGGQLRDFVYVEDVVRALLIVAVRGRTDGGAYNVATGVPTTIGGLAHQLIRLQGSSARVAFNGTVRAGDQDDLLGSTAELAAIGGGPVWSLVDGLRSTVDWFNDVYAHRERLSGRTGRLNLCTVSV